MAQHGGKRPGAGRKKGAIAQAKRDLAEMAKDHADMALRTLAQIAQTGESESARVSAANAILDRGFGKPSQAVEHSGRGGGSILLERIERIIVDPKHTNAEGLRPAIERKPV